MLKSVLNFSWSRLPYNISLNKLGRWDTNVKWKVIERRLDLANIDSCGDEICANPKKMTEMYKNNYYINNHTKT